MRSPFRSRRRQKGAVAIVFGLSVVTLFAMGGVVLDLGHLYVAKAELQNAADAAALAGAKDLNETPAGIDSAVLQAQGIAQKNKYNFSTDVTLALTNIEFGPSPDGPWSSVGAAKANPQGKTFIKVDTGAKYLNTYLMRVAGAAFNTVNTSGFAVAGRYVTDITPIGVCAVDPANKTAKYTYPTTGQTELVEFGFRRGVTYDIFGLNPLGGGPSDPYLINPVDAPPVGCNPAHSSANFTAPFLCGGNSAVISSGVGQVYTNTGLTASLAESLNSRFGDYKPSGKCIPASAPPDTNIREYPCKGPSSDPRCVNTTPSSTWMEPGGSTLPSWQSVEVNAAKKPKYQLPAAGPTPVPSADPALFAQFAKYGVLWSYGPAYQADASTPPKAGAAFTPLEANLNPMYNATAINYFDTANYPAAAGAGFPAGTPAAPYNQTSGLYFQSGGAAGIRNRRILNIVLVDCRVPAVGSASCGRMDAVGIGRFFMQTKADFTSSPKRLDLEFAGLIKPAPKSEIKIYR
ncbi:pilus assembly protein TadG-related protein [Noviherbaspirillum sedimenti]|uniref:Putative Flp pilus-assembly TadG-like N-terminal domain-containing protein n=1 Tax=Noviherbaspirillum sedimenti TaxID=2320865 RepID=A0A3A3G760_9BURK|nr:pilus assembly protein TadG-related protein [Noviherbaspirillum sedimenti]RJG03664.1 hypothetical protein D3878_20430 [Noviherbaspirillum sedimenti]